MCMCLHTKSGPDYQDVRTENNRESGKVNAYELVCLGVNFSLACDGLWEMHLQFTEKDTNFMIGQDCSYATQMTDLPSEKLKRKGAGKDPRLNF